MQGPLLDRLMGELKSIKELAWLKVQHEELHELSELPIKFSVELMAPFGRENINFLFTLDAGYPSLPPIVDNCTNTDESVSMRILEEDWSRSCKSSC